MLLATVIHSFDKAKTIPDTVIHSLDNQKLLQIL